MANNLINFYKEGISQPQLKEGVYTCKLKSHKLVDTKPENPYIALEFETETGRILKDNRFNQGFQIFISHIKQQLGRADEEIAVMDLLNELVEKGTELVIEKNQMFYLNFKSKDDEDESDLPNYEYTPLQSE